MKWAITQVSKPRQSHSNVGNMQAGLLNTYTNVGNLQVRLFDAGVDYAALNTMLLRRNALSLERRVFY